MQLLEGGDLSNRAAALNQIEVAKIIRSVANALQEAHASGILHLDVKPQNILFDEAANQPLLADFGLARLSQEAEDKHAIAGTIGYMAPEQAMGVELDSRADIYGLGATLYYLLTGKTAYKNVKLPYTDSQRESWSPIPPRSLNRNINPQLERICMRCLEFDPDARYQNCQELAKAIDQFTVAEDGLRIATIAKKTIITSPLFLAINLVVYLQIQAGWAEIPICETAYLDNHVFHVRRGLLCIQVKNQAGQEYTRTPRDGKHVGGLAGKDVCRDCGCGVVTITGKWLARGTERRGSNPHVLPNVFRFDWICSSHHRTTILA